MARSSAGRKACRCRTFFLSSITVLELESGALLVARRDPVQGASLRDWLDRQVLPRFDGRTLPISTTVTRRCAQLHMRDRRPNEIC